MKVFLTPSNRINNELLFINLAAVTGWRFSNAAVTDGAARSIKIGQRTITFKKTSPKNLLAKSEISGLAIQALKSIGQNKLKMMF